MQILAQDSHDSADHFAYNHDEFDTNHKFSFEITGSRPSTSSSSPLRSFSPLLLIETLSRKSFSYGKLPLEPIKLTVLKLDGSSFDISVVKNPTVTQLKQAVEDAFNHLPKHGIGKVSWSYVWAQFCLCFDGQKLLHDQDTVTLHGIKDSDQLQFVRHTSISYNLVKERSEKHDYDLEESQIWFMVRLLSGMDAAPPHLMDVIALLSPSSKGRSARSVISQLVLAATVYYIWKERNSRLFRKKTKTHLQIYYEIVTNVRLKLVTLRFTKNTTQVRRMIEKWKLPSSLVIYDATANV